MTRLKNEQNELSVALGHIEDDVLEANGFEKSESGGFMFKAEANAAPNEEQLKLKKVVKKEKTKPRISFEENPRTSGESNLFKRKEKLLPDSFLKDIRVNDSLVADILRVRGNTMSMFGTLRKNKFDEGLEVDVKEEFIEHITSDQMPKINERISQFKKFLINCGKVDGMKQKDKMNLSTFMDLQTKNGLTFGRYATEFVWQDGKVVYFRPTDAATIYRVFKKGEQDGATRDQAKHELERMVGEKIDISRFDSDEYAFVQVIDNIKQQAYTDKEMDVFNMYPSTDIEHRGYPVTPLDTVVSSVTTHMNIITYNRLYFQNGRAARGILIVNSNESNQTMLDDMKRHYNDSINGVDKSFRTPVMGVGQEDKVTWVPTTSSTGDGEFQFLYDQVARNILSAFAISPSEISGFGYLDKGTAQQGLSECFCSDTPLLTYDGEFEAQKILGDSKEKNIEVWTGKEWNKARVFWTEEKEVRETTIASGESLKTSPDHKFQVVGYDGNLCWKEQKELVVGDYVVVNNTKTEGNQGLVPSFNGKKLTPEMFEVLGWILGDGSIISPKKRAGGYLKFYYNPEKELPIRDRHVEILKNFGFDSIEQDVEVTEEQQEAIKKKNGFKTCAKTRALLKMYNTDFVRFCIDFGCGFGRKKTVPSKLFSMPSEYREAYLKGLFSADGHATTNTTVVLTIQNQTNRESIRRLLGTLGIRTTSLKGLNRRSFGKKTFSRKLSIKDVDSFWKTIGFLQPHKIIRETKKNWIIGDLPMYISMSASKFCLDNQSNKIDKQTRDWLVCCSQGKRGKTKSGMISLAEKCGVVLPEYILNNHFEKVVCLENLNKKERMVDVEVFNDEHAFSLCGIIVHNSSTEFKLTAARDGGLRPLVMKMQSWFNDVLFPLLDPELAQLCHISLSGLDAKTQEQESIQLQQDMPIHYNYDNVLHQVDKKLVGDSMGGKFPFNERYQNVINNNQTAGEIIGHFYNDPSAFVDPVLNYRRDPVFMAHLQMLQQANPAAFAAYFATNPSKKDSLQWLIADMLESDE